MRTSLKKLIKVVIYASYALLIVTAAWITYNTLLGGFPNEWGLVIGFFDLVIGIFGVVLALHLHVSAKPAEEEIEILTAVTRDMFKRHIILALIEREPLDHAEISQVLQNRIHPHINVRKFRHDVYSKLNELAGLRYIRLDPFYDGNTHRWIARASFFDIKTKEFFKKHQRLLSGDAIPLNRC